MRNTPHLDPDEKNIEALRKEYLSRGFKEMIPLTLWAFVILLSLIALSFWAKSKDKEKTLIKSHLEQIEQVRKSVDTTSFSLQPSSIIEASLRWKNLASASLENPVLRSERNILTQEREVAKHIVSSVTHQLDHKWTSLLPFEVAELISASYNLAMPSITGASLIPANKFGMYKEKLAGDLVKLISAKPLSSLTMDEAVELRNLLSKVSSIPAFPGIEVLQEVESTLSDRIALFEEARKPFPPHVETGSMDTTSVKQTVGAPEERSRFSVQASALLEEDGIAVYPEGRDSDILVLRGTRPSLELINLFKNNENIRVRLLELGFISLKAMGQDSTIVEDLRNEE